VAQPSRPPDWGLSPGPLLGPVANPGVGGAAALSAPFVTPKDLIFFQASGAQARKYNVKNTRARKRIKISKIFTPLASGGWGLPPQTLAHAPPTLDVRTLSEKKKSLATCLPFPALFLDGRHNLPWKPGSATGCMGFCSGSRSLQQSPAARSGSTGGGGGDGGLGRQPPSPTPPNEKYLQQFSEF
jgi:hypothetical protein